MPLARAGSASFATAWISRASLHLRSPRLTQVACLSGSWQTSDLRRGCISSSTPRLWCSQRPLARSSRSGEKGLSGPSSRPRSGRWASTASIRLHGSTSEPENALRQCDIFVLPSLSEACSNVVLEAMATGLPVVATRVGGTPALIEADRSGLLVSAGDPSALAQAILKLVRGRPLAAQLGAEARAHALAEFTMERMLERVQALYRAALEPTSRTPARAGADVATMTPARVFLAGFYPPPYAGEPIHVKQLAQFLRARGLQVEILNLNRHAPPSPEYRNASGRSSMIRSLYGLPDRSSILHLHTNGHNWKSWLMIGVAALGGALQGREEHSHDSLRPVSRLCGHPGKRATAAVGLDPEAVPARRRGEPGDCRGHAESRAAGRAPLRHSRVPRRSPRHHR